MHLFFNLAACSSVELDDSKEGPGTADSDDPGADTGDVENLDTAAEAVQGGIDGTVRVRLTTTDDAGDVVEVDWDDATGGVWPFGSLFLGAFTYPEDGEAEWLGTETWSWPDVDGNDYSFDIEASPDADIWVEAWVDWGGDGIIGSSDPTGVYPDAVHVSEGSRTEGVDVTIWTSITGTWSEDGGWGDGGDGGGDGGGGDGGGGDGGGDGGGEYDDGYVWLSGEYVADVGYDGYPCHALIYDTEDLGPYFYDEATMEDVGDGTGTGTWALPAYENWGDIKVVGGCDANWDGLLDPSDQWGSLADGGVDANPLTVSDDDIDDLRIVVPFDGFRPFASPIVGLTGTIIYDAGYETLNQDAVLHVVAMRATPTEEMDDNDLSYEYAVDHINVSDVEGTSAEFSLAMKSNTTCYLWAFLDNDADGIVNEHGEYVGSVDGGGSGAMTVGTTALDPVSFSIGPVAD